MLRKLTLTAFAGATLMGTTAASAVTSYAVDLIELNNSGVSGSVIFDVADDRSTLRARADITGLPTLQDEDGNPTATPHVNHIHGLFDEDGNAADSKVPTLDPNADMDIFALVEDDGEPGGTANDGFIQVLEAVGAYGDVLLSLEQPAPTQDSNHMGPVDQDGDGVISYDYTFDLRDEIIFSTVTGTEFSVEDLFPLDLREYVIHGGFDSDGAFSATLPVAAGQLVATDMTAPVPLPAAGWLLVAGIAGLGAIRRRG